VWRISLLYTLDRDRLLLPNDAGESQSRMLALFYNVDIALVCGNSVMGFKTGCTDGVGVEIGGVVVAGTDVVSGIGWGVIDGLFVGVGG
jgi:hypothetical protein